MKSEGDRYRIEIMILDTNPSDEPKLVYSESFSTSIDDLNVKATLVAIKLKEVIEEHEYPLLEAEPHNGAN